MEHQFHKEMQAGDGRPPGAVAKKMSDTEKQEALSTARELLNKLYEDPSFSKRISAVEIMIAMSLPKKKKKLSVDEEPAEDETLEDEENA